MHPNVNGGYLVDLTWYAAFYRESPEGKVLPVGTGLTTEQASVMQQLAWDVVKNYPDCGLYEEGTTPAATPEFSPARRAGKQGSAVTLTSKTPGAWFRYTLDGTTPTRTRGYVYCGVISVPAGHDASKRSRTRAAWPIVRWRRCRSRNSRWDAESSYEFVCSRHETQATARKSPLAVGRRSLFDRCLLMTQRHDRFYTLRRGAGSMAASVVISMAKSGTLIKSQDGYRNTVSGRGLWPCFSSRCKA